MYLVDSQIRARLADLKLAVDRADYPFDPKAQIQPCSIDLRIDSVVWRVGKPGQIDLRTSLRDKLHPRRGWRSQRVSDNEVISVKPGEVVFARVYERFEMPTDLAGKIEGRSSFARLGLAVHCTSDFINPGWRGNMPLQLFNAGPHAIRIPPLMPICQLMLIRLDKAPDRAYGHEELDSKYQNDDGGPSFWWRDRRIKALHERLQQRNLPLALEDRIAELTRGREVEIIDRFAEFTRKLRVGATEDADSVIDRFATGERNRRYANLSAKAVLGFVSLALLTKLLDAVIAGSFYLNDAATWKVLGPALVVGGFTLWFLLRPKTGYLLPENVEAHRIEQARLEEARRAAQSAASSGPPPSLTP